MGEEEKKPTVTFVDGTEVPIRPVSRVYLQQIQLRVKRELEAEGKNLEPPRYKVITAAGTVETFPHDEKSIADAPDDEKQAWVAYKAHIAEAESRYAEQSSKFTLLRGLDIEVPKEWIKEQQAEKFEIPKDPKELAWAYIERELIDTPEDAIRAMIAINALSMKGQITDEMIKAAEATFRSALGGQTAGNATPAEGQVDVQPGLR